MRIQNFLLGSSMSALLAMTVPASADQNAVQKEGNAVEAKGNAQEHKALPSFWTAFWSALAGAVMTSSVDIEAPSRKF